MSRRPNALRSSGQRDKLRQGLARLIDSYTEGYLEKPEFDSRITRQRQRIDALDEQVRQLADAEALQHELRLLIGRLEDFAAQVEEGLETADWLTRRTIIRTLVSRVEIDHAKVNVVFRVPPDPFVTSPDSLDRGVLQHYRRRNGTTLRHPVFIECDYPVLHDTGVEPFVDESKQSSIVDSVTEEFPQPIVINVVEKSDHVNFHHVLDPMVQHSIPQTP